MHQTTLATENRIIFVTCSLIIDRGLVQYWCEPINLVVVSWWKVSWNCMIVKHEPSGDVVMHSLRSNDDWVYFDDAWVYPCSSHGQPQGTLCYFPVSFSAVTCIEARHRCSYCAFMFQKFNYTSEIVTKDHVTTASEPWGNLGQAFSLWDAGSFKLIYWVCWRYLFVSF